MGRQPGLDLGPLLVTAVTPTGGLGTRSRRADGSLVTIPSWRPSGTATAPNPGGGGPAIAALDNRDKVLYRMHVVEGLTLERIAKAYGVTHPTTIRWLERARNEVLDEAKRRMREVLAVSTDEFDSISRLIVSQLALDISRAPSMNH